jgi:hypothetical protein
MLAKSKKAPAKYRGAKILNRLKPFDLREATSPEAFNL